MHGDVVHVFMCAGDGGLRGSGKRVKFHASKVCLSVLVGRGKKKGSSVAVQCVCVCMCVVTILVFVNGLHQVSFQLRS